jgi:surfeit locus 1 family protein
MPRRFRPGLWATLFLIPALALTIGLGVWQLERRAWKADLLARIQIGIDNPAVPLPSGIDDPAAWAWRQVTVEGRFDHAHELYLVGRAYEGRNGLHVVTPLLRADGGQPVLVDRGWVPLERQDPAARAAGLPDGVVTVAGVLRRPPDRGWMQPDNDPAGNHWFWIDLPAMAESAGLTAAVPMILEAAPGADPTILPIGGQTRIDLPNDHLAYAVTWFSFAGILLVIYVISHLRRRPEGEEEQR